MSLESSNKDGCIRNQRRTNGIVGNGLLSVISRQGQLVGLRTKAEVENSLLQVIPAYMVEIPQSSANDILKAIDALIHEHCKGSFSLQHLRRIIKPGDLPMHLKQNPDLSSPDEVSMRKIRSDFHSIPCAMDSDDLRDSARQQSQPSLCLLVSLTTSLPMPLLSTLFMSLLPKQPTVISTILVPQYPPMSAHQAQEWSQSHWPTVHRKHNPFGPQPSTIQKAEASILPKVGHWMGLALMAGAHAEEREIGVKIGAVIVEKGLLVAVAGDGRWTRNDDGIFATNRIDIGARRQGNPMAHAVMRAIALVARKRRDVLAQQSSSISEDKPKRQAAADNKQKEVHFLDKPFTALEKEVYKGDSITAGGYLCLDMDIYITHEPCVMCSMAILHSRFGKVVYGQRMAGTGGLCAEAEQFDASSCDNDGYERRLGHGLFWRQELNWRLLAWYWEDKDKDIYAALGDDTHPNASDNYHLRMHRARSVILTADELVEIRAAQRTFEGAYIRTALGQFSFALVILKIFTSEFYSIGALFAIYGSGILLTSLLRRQQGNKQFFSEIGEDGLNQKKFRTSGNVVVVLTALSVAAYACLLGLTLKLGE
ncbi:MAG: hypothetical protein Q9177_001760 [Variospora cf. flavescens]